MKTPEQWQRDLALKTEEQWSQKMHHITNDEIAAIQADAQSDLKACYAKSLTNLTDALKRLASIRMVIERTKNRATSIWRFDGPSDATISDLTASDIRNIWILAADYKTQTSKERKEQQ